MFHRFTFTALLILLICVCVRSVRFQKTPRKNWAVLVAGSDGWWNYRHQADVCHAYQLLRARGIPKENIITFMVDDIANHSYNPFYGKIFNDYHHKDVYNGVVIDYRGEDVTPDNFVRVLKGDSKLRKAGRKVLQSTAEDNVFIYFTDHGAPGIIAFPDDDLSAKRLNDTISYMFEHKMYNQMVLYIEACESGSMFEKILSDHIKVYATTASRRDESSYATFCDDPQIDTCLADEYSYNWMSDTEAHDPHNWTLDDQYKSVKKLTKESHPQQYGDAAMKKLNIDQFQAHNSTIPRRTVKKSIKQTEHHVPSYHVRMHTLAKRMLSAESEEAREFYRRILSRSNQIASLAESTVNEIASHVRATAIAVNIPDKSDQLACFEQVYKIFKRRCFTIQQVPEVAPQLVKLNNLCEKGFAADALIHSIEIICG